MRVSAAVFDRAAQRPVPSRCDPGRAGRSLRTVPECFHGKQVRKGPARDGDHEEYYSARPQDKDRWVGAVITDYPFKKAEDFKSETQAKMIIKKWLETGLLEHVEYYCKRQRKDRKGVTAVGRVGAQ